MVKVFQSLCLPGTLAAATQRPRNSTLHRLTRRLLKKYSKGVRPVRNWSKPTIVYLDLFVHAVLDVDAQNQKLTTSIWYRQIWKDEYLTWNSSRYDGIKEISLPIHCIWAPDIIVGESVDASKSPDLPFVYLNASGVIKNYKPMQVVSACILEMYTFPFDTQNCSLTFSSALHTVQDVDLAFWRRYEEINSDQKLFLNDGEWELVSVLSERHILQTQTGSIAQIRFHIVITRRPLLYVVSLLIPSIFLLVVDLGSFYLPPNSGTRITFKTSVLVGYTLFKVNMSDELPSTGTGTSLISAFFTICMALLVLSLSKSIFLIKFLHLGDDCTRDKPFASYCCRSAVDTAGENAKAARSTGGKAGTAAELERRVSVKPSFISSSNMMKCFCLSAGIPLAWEGSSVKNHATGTATPPMEKIRRELLPISSHFRALGVAAKVDGDWLSLANKLDKLLFRAYLLVLAVYAVTMGSLWGMWSSQ
ncbi:5-hydroxytryptamine receptor 3B [Lacerta agilis]|uniref:5-hydroxytryptamine receptor 3B n=1 Tax=Lacerta agilis TaxID=80427 RepID=UPI001419EB9F|nr:5-hydroxytryptamine receptor 3B [Lacerta agilis]